MLKKIKRGVKKIMKEVKNVIETKENIINKFCDGCERVYNDIYHFVSSSNNKLAIAGLFFVSAVLQKIDERR